MNRKLENVVSALIGAGVATAIYVSVYLQKQRSFESSIDTLDYVSQELQKEYNRTEEYNKILRGFSNIREQTEKLKYTLSEQREKILERSKENGKILELIDEQDQKSEETK